MVFLIVMAVSASIHLITAVCDDFTPAKAGKLEACGCASSLELPSGALPYPHALTAQGNPACEVMYTGTFSGVISLSIVQHLEERPRDCFDQQNSGLNFSSAESREPKSHLRL